MAVIEIARTTRLDGPIQPEGLTGVLYTTENIAHQFVISCTRNGADVALSGTVTGKFIRSADNATVPLTGSISNGKAYVTLNSSCYLYNGHFDLSIFVTENSAVTCVYAAAGHVRRTDGETTVDPSGEITIDVNTLLAAIETATASIPADYSDLLDTIADTFSAEENYVKGRFVWQSGTLYRFKAPHTAGSWTGTDVNAVVLANDISALREGLENIVEKGPNLIPADAAVQGFNGVVVTYKNGHVNVTGTANNSGGRTRILAEVTLPAGTYTARVFNVDAHSKAYPEIFVQDKADNSIIASVGVQTPADAAVTLAAQKTVFIGVNVVDTREYDSDFDFQLEAGSSSTAYMPPFGSATDYYAREDITDLKSYVTPEMFGAVGDGVTKDGAAVQAALNSGKTVVGSGIYNIDTDTPYSNLYYIGIPDGARMVGGTYKFPDDGYSDTEQAVGMSAFVGNSFSIENVTFDMNGYENIPVATTVMYCVFVDTCANVSIKNCKFKDSAGRNYIFVKRGYEFRLEDCVFHNGGTNLDGSDATKQNDFSYVYTSAENSIITGCVVEEPDDDVFWYCGGFEIHGNNCRVQNCEIHDCIPAIYVTEHWAHHDTTYDIKILDNAFINCQGGVSLFNNVLLDNIEVSGNYITLAPISPVNRPMYGIGSGTGNTLSNFIVIGNTIIQNEASTYGCSGISWGNASNVRATHNILKNIPTPFWIGGNTANNDIVISHNMITASAASAVYAITREYASAAINRLTVCENEVRNYAGLLDSISNVDDYLVLDRIVDMSVLIEKSKNIVPVGTNTATLYTVDATYKNGVVTLNGTSTGSGGRNTNLSPKWTLPAGTYTWRVTTDDALPPRMMVFVQTGTTIVSQSESNYATATTFTLTEATEVYLSINVATGSYVGKMYWQMEAGESCGVFIPSGAYTAVDLIARNG